MKARLDLRFAEVALRRPNHPAVVDGDRIVTYRELGRLAQDVADALAAAGAHPGTAVGLRCRRGWRVVAAILGVWRHGCSYVPIDPDHPASRQDDIVTETGLAYLVEESATGLEVRKADGQAAVVPALPSDTAYVMFTSGSTGRPKGVVIRQPNLCSMFDATLRNLGFGSDEIWSQVHSHNFDFSVWEMWGALLSGGTCVLVPDQVVTDAGGLADFLRQNQVTVASFVPTVLARLIEALQTRRQHLPALRQVVLGGEALPPAVARRWLDGGFAPAARTLNMYGITEITVHATVKVVDGSETSAASCIGRPLSNTRIALADGDTPVPDGSPGEILVSGGGVAWGYLGRPELTAERFVRLDLDGEERNWYRSGDFAVRGTGGELTYLGRRDDQVKVRGVRVELSEIEHVVSAHPAVTDACAVPVAGADGTGVEIAVAWTGALITTDTELRDWVRGRLPLAFVPRFLHRMDVLPVNANGKIDRRRIREMIPALPPAALGSGEWNGAVAELWRRLVGGAGGFLSEGGNSLVAAQLLASIRTEVGVGLPISLLLKDNLTLAGLLAVLSDTRGGDRAAAGAPGRTRAAESPLAPGQRRLWLLDRTNPRAHHYNVIGGLRLRGALAQETIRSALSAAIARRDLLSARIITDADGAPRWRYSADSEVGIRFVVVDHALDEGMITQFLRRVGAEPLPLDTGPVVAAAVLVSGDDAVVALSLHHIVADEVSLDLVLADFAEACSTPGAAFTRAAPSFADHAVIESGAVGGRRWTADLGYWTDLLKDAPTETRLPFRGPGTGALSARTCSHKRVLEADLSADVDRVLSDRSVTAFTFFLACISLVLREWSAHPTVVVGTPAVRRRSSVELGLVGFLLNTLPIRVDVDSCEGFGDLLEHVRDRCVAALEHDTPPFDAIVEALGIPVDPRRNPVFNVWVNDLTAVALAPRIDGLLVDRVRCSSLGPLFELNFYLRRHELGYEVELLTSEQLVAADVAAELLDQCVAVAEQVAADPSVALVDLSLVTSTARTAGAAFTAAVPQLPPGRGPLTRFLEVAAAHPDQPALVAPDGVLTFADLRERTARLAEELSATGVERDEVVEIRGVRGAHLPIALMAVWQAGAVAGLVDSTLPSIRTDMVGGVLAARCRLRLPNALDDEPFILSGQSVRRFLPRHSHVLFTSGSGGSPRGVVITADVLHAVMDLYTATIAASVDDRIAMLAGVGHDPVLRDVLVPLMTGATLVVPAEGVIADPVRLVSFMRDSAVTVLHTTPALLERVVAGAESLPGRALAEVRLVVCSGASLSSALVRRVRRAGAARVVNAFGTTETPQIATWREVEDHELETDRPLPVGNSGGTSRIVVVTRTGKPAGVGQRGEVLVRGRYLAGGYLDGDDSRFIDDPGGAPGARAFRTGDLGRLDPSGAVHLDGRVDRQLQIDGFRVEPAEIEQAALGLGGVRQAAAAVTETPAGPRITLYVVGAPGVAIDLAALRRQLRRTLPEYALPSGMEQVSSLRTSVNHKVLAEPVAPLRTSPAAAVQPGTDTLKEVLRILCDLVDHPVGPEENFFEAGLTSVTLMRLHRELVDQVAVALPISALFSHPNARSLATRLDSWTADRHVRTKYRPSAESVERTRQRRRQARNAIRHHREVTE